MRLCYVRQTRVQKSPWPPPDEYRDHARTQRRQNVVIQPVAHVSDLACCKLQLTDDLLKELGLRLLRLPALGGSHKIHRQPKTRKRLFSHHRLIARNPDPQAAFMQRVNAARGIRIKIAGIEYIWIPKSPPLLARQLEIEPGRSNWRMRRCSSSQAMLAPSSANTT